MDNNNGIPFNSEILRFLELALQISITKAKYSCLTDLTFFIALVSSTNTALYRRFLEIGKTEEEIQMAATQTFNQYSQTIYEQKPLKSICISNRSYTISDNLYVILKRATYIAENYYRRESTCTNDLIVACTEFMPDVFDDFLENLNAIPKPNNQLLKGETTMISIPTELSSCLTILNSNFSYDEVDCKILGRDEEVLKLVRILAKDTKRNAVLVGEPGVGKTALVEKFTWMIVTGNCPKKFENSIVVSLDVNAIIAGTQFRGSAELRFQKLIAFLEKNPNCILFIDEVHNLLGAGACRDGDLDLANALKPILARGKTQVIGATTSGEYDNYFSRDAALKRRFEKIEVHEPKTDEIYPMIKNQIQRLCESHNVLISKEIVDMIIFYASCFNFETKNPDRTLDLIDKSMVIAELSGESEVTRDDVLENFNVNKKAFEETPLKEKIALAYHEAGHYIVHRFADKLYNQKTIAVSIMPAEDYYGVNVFEYDKNIISPQSRDYYIQNIAAKLGGRIAEKMYSNELTAGASNDLKSATEIAENIVLKFGLSSSFSSNRAYLINNNINLINDTLIDKINEEIDKILEEANEYATKILMEHASYLDILQTALLEKGMLSEEEINTLFSEADKTFLTIIE